MRNAKVNEKITMKSKITPIDKEESVYIKAKTTKNIYKIKYVIYFKPEKKTRSSQLCESLI